VLLNVRNAEKQLAEMKNSASIVVSHLTSNARNVATDGGLCTNTNFALPVVTT
jgi:hypothetical protein